MATAKKAPRIIKHVITWKRPLLYPKQEAAIFHDSRYVWIEASTKSGKTVGCLVWLTEQAFLHGRAGWNGWWVAPSRKQAMIAFDRLKRYLPPGSFESNNTDLIITLIHNQARLWFKTAEIPDTLYGEDVHAAVIDEASRCREPSWHALRSTLSATRGWCRAIGNVKGRKNWFYRMCRMAEAGEPNHHYAVLSAMDAVDAGVLENDEVEDARRSLPEAVFRELYYNEASADGGNPFGLANIAKCVVPSLSGKPVRVWGWDLARSQDWCVGIGLDTDGNVAQFHRWQQPWMETEAQIAQIIGTQTPTLVDATGVGDPVTERLKRRNGWVEGFVFTGGSKQHLMERLALGIQQGQIHYPDGPIRHELEAFEYEFTRTGVRYSAPDGQHDDCVCALALAWLKLESLRGARQAAQLTAFTPF